MEEDAYKHQYVRGNDFGYLGMYVDVDEDVLTSEAHAIEIIARVT